MLENQERILEKLENGAPVVHSIYLDLKREFDRCPFKLLIVRMKKAGITNKMLKFISNFLRDRTFQVIANGSISKGRPVLSGTPQGSGLSPVLFAIFIQSLAEILDERIKKLEAEGSTMVRGVKHFRDRFHYSMYADDVKLCASIVDESDMETMQETLEVVFSWAESHGMKFSTGKTKCLKIGRETIIGNYRGAEGEVLEWEESLKD